MKIKPGELIPDDSDRCHFCGRQRGNKKIMLVPSADGTYWKCLGELGCIEYQKE